MEQKRGEGKQRFKKRRGQTGLRGGYLKRGWTETSLRTMFYASVNVCKT